MSTMTHTLTVAPDERSPMARPARIAHHDLVVRGALDAQSVPALRELVAAAVQDGPALVLVEVTDVTSVTPSGLVGVIELLRLSRSRGGDLRLWGASATVIDAQLQADLTHIARVYGSRQAAIAAGRRRPPLTRRRSWPFAYA